MHYTFDGSEPDSVLSPLYKDFVAINKPGVLKVKAFLPGWISSEIVTRNFYKTGFVADSIRLVTNPAPAYAGEGGKTIVDAEKGDLDYKSGKWLGFMDEELKAYLYFNKPVRVSNISFSTLVDIGSYIMPPQQLEVWGGTTLSDLVLLKKINPKQPVRLEPSHLTGVDCIFTPKEINILKIVAKPVSRLPAWHPGKGKKGWVFVDEIFIN